MQQTRLRFRLACAAFRSDHHGCVEQIAEDVTLQRVHCSIAIDCTARLEVPSTDLMQHDYEVNTSRRLSISHVECLSVACYSLFPSGPIMMNCVICKMAHQHILRFLFVRGLVTILLLGGLGVEDIQNAPILRYGVLFVGLRRRGSLPVKIKNTC